MIVIRDAERNDVGGIANLAAQLGYRVSDEIMRSRLEDAAKRPYEKVIVAEDEANKVVGWCTLEIISYIHVDPFVEITGFVVDEKSRKQGIGRKLVAAAEKWVGELRLSSISLHTNVIRKEAHLFYEANGFKSIKQQYVYMKQVDG
jgi:N-acetylglutamate synthase-like GNAT family acetyltransferase